MEGSTWHFEGLWSTLETWIFNPEQMSGDVIPNKEQRVRKGQSHGAE